MSRPRKMTAAYCITCRRTSYQSEAERALLALHRMEHKRLDRRRAQWRAYGKRKRNADGRIGGLHSLKCKSARDCVCRPIPVYRVQGEDVA